MVNYPNGKRYVKPQQAATKETKKKTTNPDYANRGMGLEKMIETTNKYYLDQHIAVIHKKPTPIQIVDVSYPKRELATITRAYFRVPSTLDFNGVYKGQYIDFDVKETQSKTSFPLKNFHTHQIEHMEAVLQQQGICFAIIGFTKINEYYLLPAIQIIKHWYEQLQGGRKSIAYKDIQQQGYLIQQGYIIPLDYIKILDQLIS